MAERLRRTSTPMRLLLAIALLSLGARLAWVEQPCRTPCRTAADHVLVFDETYYVNAARVIAGLAPPAGQRYAHAPLGDDPNAEHPQLAKLAIAGSIELLGDGPLAWRLGSVIAGTLALLGMFALVRAAGAGEWVALTAAALMSADNLLLVHGRIATLDIYVLAAMLWSVALYLRGRPVAAGVLLGIGACFKLVAPYAVAVLAVYEALLLLRTPSRSAWRGVLARLAGCTAAAGAVGFGLLALMDRIAPPYDASTGKLVGAGPLGHLGHMLSYASQQTSPDGPTGIASYPWGWLIDLKPIVYLNIDPSRPAPGLRGIHPPVHFLGMISPPILLLALPALAWLACRMFCGGLSLNRAPVLALAWFAGTFIPFVLLSLLWGRTSYLYYMVIVMPGLYLAGACVLPALVRRHRRMVMVWGVAVLAAAVVMFPFTPLP